MPAGAATDPCETAGEHPAADASCGPANRGFVRAAQAPTSMWCLISLVGLARSTAVPQPPRWPASAALNFGQTLAMQHRPCELIVEGDTVFVPRQRGSTARVEILDDGFCVTVGRDHTVLPATGSGLTRAATRFSAAAVARVRRRAPSPDFFARDVVDVASVSRVKRLLWRMWAERATRLNPACAPLVSSRRVRQALVVCGTPAFLRIPWLLDDALRFRAARAVLARVPLLGNRSPDVWEPWSLSRQIDIVSRWRHLLCPEGVTRVPRAVNVTIERFNFVESALPGDALDPRHPRTSYDDHEEDSEPDAARLDGALCSLQFLTLVRPVESYRHLLVLSGFGLAGSRQPRGVLEPRSAFLQRLDVEDLDDGIDAFARALDRSSDEPTLPALLGWYLARGTSVPRGGGLASLARRTVELVARGRPASPERVTKMPPVPLPIRPGVRFLANSTDVFDEGNRMHHCVAVRAAAAVDGRAFLFHVEHEGTNATIEVDARGQVVEAKGPANGTNTAVNLGRDVLARWGLGFRLGALLEEVNGDVIVGTHPAGVHVDDACRLLCAAAWPPVTKDDETLHTLGDLRSALVNVQVPAGRVRPFLRRHLARCQRGETWLVLRRQADGAASLVVIDAAGQAVAALGRMIVRRRRPHSRKSAKNSQTAMTFLLASTATSATTSKDPLVV